MTFSAKYRRTCSVCILVALLLCSFSACQKTKDSAIETPAVASDPSTGPLSEPASFSGVTITFATYESARQTFEHLAEEFHDLNPDIQISVVAMPDTGNEASYEELLYQTVSEADTGLFWIDHTATRYGLVQDLSPLIDGDTTFEPDDFYPQLLDIHRWDGGTWALPCCLGMGLIYYDRQAFRDAGIPYPEAGWTLDDFLHIAQQLTLREDETVLQYGFVDLLGASFQSFVLSQVSALRDPASGLPALDTQEAVQALQWTVDLTLLHGVMLHPNQDNPYSPREIVESGGAAMWSNGLAGTYSPEMQVSDIGAVPFPEADRASNWGTFNGYFMSSGTHHFQESWRWIKFLTQRQIAVWDYLAPVRRSVAEETHYWQRFKPEEAAAAQYAAEHLSLLMHDEANTSLRKALRQALDGEDVTTAVAQAQESALDLHEQWSQVTPRVVDVAPRESAPDTGKRSITFAPPYYVADLAAWTAIAEDFNREYPDLSVRIDHYSADGIDCLIDSVPVLENTGAPVRFLNLQPLLEQDSHSPLEGVTSDFRQAVEHQGDLWGHPFQAHVYVIYYNRDLFDAAGEAYPRPSWTLDDFLRTAQRLTMGSGDARQWGYLPLNAPSQDLRAFLAVQGVNLWDENGQPRFDAPDVIKAVAWYVDLILEHRITPNFAGDFSNYQASTAESLRELVSKEQVAMWSSYTDQTANSAHLSVGMVSLPINSLGGGIGIYHYEAAFIASQTPDADACWEWIRYLSTVPEVVQGMPAQTGMLDSPALQARLGEEAVAAYRATLAYEPLLPLSLSKSADIYWLYQAVDEVLAGALVEGALTRAQERAQQ